MAEPKKPPTKQPEIEEDPHEKSPEIEEDPRRKEPEIERPPVRRQPEIERAPVRRQPEVDPPPGRERTRLEPELREPRKLKRDLPLDEGTRVERAERITRPRPNASHDPQDDRDQGPHVERVGLVSPDAGT